MGGEVTPESVGAVVTQAVVLKEQGQLEQAEGMLQQAWRAGKDMLGDSHPVVLSALSNLGALYQAMGRLDAAAAMRLADAAVQRLKGVRRHLLFAVLPLPTRRAGCWRIWRIWRR